ncbi:MAG: VIT domain-containing protein, partial [Ilumatobacteraceae bacterium]
MAAQTLPSTGINLRAGAIDLPLESVDVAATVDGRGVTWTVTQTFTNTMTDAAEAVYTFPLPNEGAVAGVTMRIGDRTIAADIKPRDEARIEYEEAVASGHTASLLEQEAGEIFTMSVGNIHPGETISVVVTVHDTVLLEDDEASVRMPTLVKTRYVAADVPNAGEVSPPRHHGEVHVNSTVRIAFAEPVADPVCDTIPGATVRPDSVAVDGFALDRDIVVRWQVPAAIAEAKWVADPDDPAMGTIEVDIRTAPDATVGRRQRVLQITVDRSGSMGGDAMTMAIRV